MGSAEKQNFPDRFRSPQRRLTRQRSGHNVSGEGTGSTCKIERTIRAEPENKRIEFEVSTNKVTATGLFLRKIGVAGAGIYLRPEAVTKCTGSFSYQMGGEERHHTLNSELLDASGWHRAGILVEIQVA